MPDLHSPITLSTVYPHIQHSSRYSAGSLIRRQLSRTHIEIARGTHLARAFLNTLGPFDVDRTLHIARAIHAQREHPGSIIAGPSALICHGVSLLDVNRLPVMITARRQQKHHSFVFQPIASEQSSHLRSVRLQRTSLTALDVHAIPELPIPTLPLLDSAIQCARLLPKETGLTAFLMAAQRIAEFDRRQLVDSRERLSSLSAYCQRLYEELPYRARGRKRMKDASILVREPVESILEARFHYLLYQHKFSGYHTQQPIQVGAKTYFPDFLFSEHKLAIELDGQAKYGDTRESQLESRLSELQRQYAIEKFGWRFMRFTWSDLSSPRLLVSRIRQELRTSSFYYPRPSA